ncbi:6-carboxytetrahydropterin synthase [Candidatus Nitrospira neomarina]|uniref:6-carboxy-5,6,7,8-tetrahydropterin synthase n=1 Tax=Candidatus Nitrospira neomarina TaxID=3020899 RepID=A0AA96GF55_9BACT|nr:6-carboxytetrahydropterin synthase [Candidatus Nitrospira neomarina]WNM60728.1 6-carboxytetrahydropterin synthase [Candidatus Nitrospira neomarina]
MPKATLTKRLEFCSSHRYHNPEWDDAKNRAVFGLCNNVNTHGHNYLLEVTLRGDIDPVTGMIINLYDLKLILNQVLEQFDHKNLNLDTPYFSKRIPTTENLAVTLWHILEKHPDLPNPDALRLYEDETLYAEVNASFMGDALQPANGESAIIARHYAFSALHQSGTGHTQGHDYALWIATKGQISSDTGQVMNLQTVDQIVRNQILARFDQRNLSQDQAFANIPVTDSALAKVIWETLEPHFHTPPLCRVSVSQQPGAVAVYSV